MVVIQSKKSGKNVWFYWNFNDFRNSIQSGECINCKTREEAIVFGKRILSSKIQEDEYLISKITEGMYEKNSVSYKRRQLYGCSVDEITLCEKKRYLSRIREKFGNYRITELTEPIISTYLISLDKSGSWKNCFLETFADVYREAKWQGINIQVPTFQRFKRMSKKADILTDSEIKLLFNVTNFKDYTAYLMFLLCLVAGLRIGEVRAIKVMQLIEKENALVINGFIRKNEVRTNYNKTGSSENPRHRAVVIPPSVMNKIIFYINANHLTSDDYVFAKNNKPYSRDMAAKIFKKALTLAGISTIGRKITPHSLRYTYVTKMRNNLSADIVQKIAGHSSIEMTEYYTRTEIKESITALKPVLPVTETVWSKYL